MKNTYLYVLWKLIGKVRFEKKTINKPEITVYHKVRTN
ncbi:hypothetical protein FLJU110815_16080 [Flavobacterium jumunjinense]